MEWCIHTHRTPIRHTDVVYPYCAYTGMQGFMYSLAHLQAQGVYHISHLCAVMLLCIVLVGHVYESIRVTPARRVTN